MFENGNVGIRSGAGSLPAQEEWSKLSRAYAGAAFHLSRHRLAGQRRRVRLYLPDVPVVPSLVTGTHGWRIWFGNHLAQGSAPPLTPPSAADASRRWPVLGIININAGGTRHAILGGRREAGAFDIAERLLPTFAPNTERRWADRTQTVLAGQPRRH